MTVCIENVVIEHVRGPLLVVASARPRLSWRFSDAADASATPQQGNGWVQRAYRVRWSQYDGTTGSHASEELRVDSTQSVLVPWPGAADLCSRQQITVQVQACGGAQDDASGSWTDWSEPLSFEVGLLEASCWTTADRIAASDRLLDDEDPKRPIYFRGDFFLESLPAPSLGARLYITSFGAYQAEINGKAVGDQVLAPGWTSYQARHQYQTFDISPLLRKGHNTLGVIVGEGWYAGRLGFMGGFPNIWGSTLGALGQLWVDGKQVFQTDSSWQWCHGPILESSIYNGEIYDSRLAEPAWSVPKDARKATRRPAVPTSPPNGAQEPPTTAWDWKSVVTLEKPEGVQIIPDMAPIRRIEHVSPVSIFTSPSGKTILDFGQNLVGWIRLNRSPPPRSKEDPEQVVLYHAEVLEHGELGRRPLRGAEAREILVLGGDLEAYEPHFTFHGFRYAQVDGWSDPRLEDFTAVVVHTDMERTGWFSCSHKSINRLHDNILWSMRGNFVGVPTDCPQRDERLGWTGDLQVFCRTANFLYDTSSILSGWLQDLWADQQEIGGIPPMIVPDLRPLHKFAKPSGVAVWGDVVALAPWDLYSAFDDSTILERQYKSMQTWLDETIPRSPEGLWTNEKGQLGDHLAPDQPANFRPGRTDPHFVANAYLIRVTRTLSRVARILGKEADADRYAADAKRLYGLFQQEYVAPSGRVASDSQTAYALVLQLDLLPSEKQTLRAAERLKYLVRLDRFKVGTGFVGTPLLLDALAAHGHEDIAYRMLQEKSCPSWLYGLGMGATTIWERYDSMLPDGTIHPDEMTSFNHYALGAIANFMHQYIGGISMLEPGWKKTMISPRPGGTVKHASVSHLTPYGLVECKWRLDGRMMTVDICVPPNTTAVVDLPGLREEIGSGRRSYTVEWEPRNKWPPAPEYWDFTKPWVDDIADD